jgi:alanyl-tRNA synthetase
VVAEEETFVRTLAAGSTVLDEAIKTTLASAKKSLPGDTAFLLHDTYGFPIDLTLEIAGDAGIDVDRDEFKKLMAEQKDRAKADAREKKLGGTDLSVYSEFRALGETRFTGYDELETEGKVIGLIREGNSVTEAVTGDVIEVILSETSLYAESGGQEADSGLITGDGFELEVLDVQKPVKGLISHRAIVREGSIGLNSKAVSRVDFDWRLGACQAHSATHVMHAALRQVLGPNALQSGSYNKPGYLRLDFSWQQALSAETKSEIEEVSNLAIRGDLAVSAQFMSLPEAKAWGAVALFGETYDESVRVIQIGGPWSRELCGGTHVSRSSQIGLVSLFGESSVGSGSRRIEALVGIDAVRALTAERALITRVQDLLKVPREQVEERLFASLDELKVLQKKIATLAQTAALSKVEHSAKASENIGSVNFAHVELGDVTDLDVRSLALQMLSLAGKESVVAVVSGTNGDKAVLGIAVSKAAITSGVKAGDLARTASGLLGGGGGGRDDFAQAGGPKLSETHTAIKAIKQSLA